MLALIHSYIDLYQIHVSSGDIEWLNDRDLTLLFVIMRRPDLPSGAPPFRLPALGLQHPHR